MLRICILKHLSGPNKSTHYLEKLIQSDIVYLSASIINPSFSSILWTFCLKFVFINIFPQSKEPIKVNMKNELEIAILSILQS